MTAYIRCLYRIVSIIIIMLLDHVKAVDGVDMNDSKTMRGGVLVLYGEKGNL
jgi:hypothetical protein